MSALFKSNGTGYNVPFYEVKRAVKDSNLLNVLAAIDALVLEKRSCILTEKSGSKLFAA